MENNNRYSKYLAIIALLISVVGVSLGFAAFSNTVQIKAQADVRPERPDNVVGLSTDPDDQENGNVTPTTTGGATAENATVTKDSIENIKVHFTEPGQSATYSFYAVNTSEFVAYLNSVVFGTKTCTPYTAATNPNPATAELVTSACSSITMTIAIGGNDYLETESNINGVTMAVGASVPVAVTIDYEDGGAVADGDFDVDFGTSTITYGTVD